MSGPEFAAEALKLVAEFNRVLVVFGHAESQLILAESVVLLLDGGMLYTPVERL